MFRFREFGALCASSFQHPEATAGLEAKEEKRAPPPMRSSNLALGLGCSANDPKQSLDSKRS